jgi:hypothetical protein
MLDGGRIALLRAAENGLRLETAEVAGPALQSTWSLQLPSLPRARLIVAPPTQLWRVSRGPGRKQSWFDGRLGETGYETVDFATEGRGVFAAAGDGSGGILVVPHYEHGRRGRWPAAARIVRDLLVGDHEEVRAEIRHIDSRGETSHGLGETTSWLECDDAALGTRRFLCSATTVGRGGTLWWLEARPDALALTPLAGGDDGNLHFGPKASPDGSVAWRERDGLAWLDPSRHVGVRLPHKVLAGGADDSHLTLFALAPSRLAAAVGRPGTWRLSVFKLP